MRSVIRPCLALAVGLLIGSVFALPIEAQSIVGGWRLVEQTYGKGEANLVDHETEPLRIEFLRQGAEIEGRIRAGDRASLSWPRLVTDGARTVRIAEKRLSVAEDSILVRYRVDPAPGDDLVLEVTEEYRAIEEGRILVGTVSVRFERDGHDRGSYTLHRRFEKEP